MSIFYRTREPKPDVQRSMTMPDIWKQYARVNYANVDPTAGFTSMQSVAVWSTADFIASVVSELPAEVFAGKRKRSTPWNIDDPGDDGMGREDWLYRVMMSWLIRGNLYGADNSWDARGLHPLSFSVLSPLDVTAQVVDSQPQWYFKGQRLEGAKLDDFRHVPVFTQPGVLLGQSVVEAHATSLGVSLRSAQFGDQWFRDGAHPSGMLVNKAPLDNVDAENAKRRLIDATQGSLEPLVLGEGWDYKNLQVSPNESQFLETQKYSEAQCARMFGPGFAEVLGYESGGSMTYSNVNDRDLFLAKYSLNKWIRRVERLLSSLLPPSTQVVKLNREGLLEATTLQRYQAHKLALDGGWMLPSEVRDIEDLPPIPGIDDRKPNSQGVNSGNAAQS